jgi:hypothetical protein
MRLLYEKSISYRGHLIIPFRFSTLSTVREQPLHSYVLLSELGMEGRFHQVENPGGLCTDSVEGIVSIAKKYLDSHSAINSKTDYFKNRYTYRDNLIIIFGMAGKYFYDHYPPHDLNNIAAPRIFTSEQDCIDWIKVGMDLIHADQEQEVEKYLLTAQQELWPEFEH